MKAKETRSDPIKKLIYYLDEVIVFAVMVLSILFSETIIRAIKSGIVPTQLAHISLMGTLVASFIGIMVYGIENESFKFNYEKDKPPMMKRCFNSMIHGVAWKSIIGFTDL